MALEDFELPTLEVGLPGGDSFAVRGLSLQDITKLMSQHGNEMEAFFQKYAGNPSASPLSVGMDLIDTAPMLLNKMIAMAADRPHLTDKVAKLPLTVQQEAIEKIAQLTFDAAGGPKKFIEAVVRLIKGINNLMPESQPSPSGLPGSDAK